MADYRGVSDIVEDGHGGFTMDSVFYHANGTDRYVTSVFKKTEPESSEEVENWNPSGFNYKAAVDSSPQRKKSEAQKEKIKKVHRGKKSNSGRKKKAEDPYVKRHLEESFDDNCSNNLADVTNNLGKEEPKAEERGVKELMKSLKKEQGINCVGGTHIKGKVGDFENLEVYPVAPLEDTVHEIENQRIKDLKKDLKIDYECEEHVKGLERFYKSMGFTSFSASDIFDQMKEQEAKEKLEAADRKEKENKSEADSYNY